MSVRVKWDFSVIKMSIAVIVLIFGISQIGNLRAGISRNGGRLGLPPVNSILLQGATPTIAWSENSKRVLVNSIVWNYEEEGEGLKLGPYDRQSGVYILEMDTGKIMRAHNGHGYHPFWQDDSTIVWSNIAYGEGEQGVFGAKLGKDRIPKVTRLGDYEGALLAYPGTNGQILFFSDYPESKGWLYYNMETGQSKDANLPGSEWDYMWGEFPEGVVKD